MDMHNTHRLLPANTRLVLTAVVALLALLLPGTAIARTEVERIHLEDQFVDPFVSELCGTEVTVTLELDVTHHSFDDDPLRHRQELRQTLTVSSDHGMVIFSLRLAGVHEVVEVLEELEPDVFRVRVHATEIGRALLKTPNGRLLARDAGTITYDDIAVWDRPNDFLAGPEESTVTRITGPHALFTGEEDLFGLSCAELAP